MRCIDDTLITAGIVYREAEAAPVNKKLRLEPFADLRDCASSPASEHFLERKRSGISNSILDCQTDSLHICQFRAVREDFSSVGRTVTDMRSRLSADKVEAIELVFRWGRRAGLSDD